MKKFNLKEYLYHGIVDWNNYNRDTFRLKFCLAKLESILRCRYICRPCDFNKFKILHRDCANLYTFYFTFAACHPESIYASRFRKEIKDDNGYVVATEYAKLGILLDSELLHELSINNDSFCDKEILIEDNISIDKYGLAIYINPIYINAEMYFHIMDLLKKYNYNFKIVNIIDGSIIDDMGKKIDEAKKLVKKK